MYNKIKELHLEARVNRDSSSSLLGLILGEVETAVKRGDEQNIDTLTEIVIKKLVASANKNIEATSGDAKNPFIAECDYLLLLLEKYGTTLMSEHELLGFFASHEPANIGEAMKLVKQQHAGKYDSKMASAVAKKFLELK